MNELPEEFTKYFEEYEKKCEELDKKVYKSPDLDTSIEMLGERIDLMTDLYNKLIELDEYCGGLANKFEKKIKEEEEKGKVFKAEERKEEDVPKEPDDLIQCMTCGELVYRKDKLEHQQTERHKEYEKKLEKNVSFLTE